MAKHRGGHHGGAWKVAYADFVTAMMALFLVLWLTAQDSKIKEAVERAFRHPFSSLTEQSVGILPSKDNSAVYKAQGDFESISAVEMEKLRRLTEDLAKILQQEDGANNVQMELTPDGLRINVFDRSSRPVFEPNTPGFTTYGAWVFSTLAWEIARYHSFRIELEGHTETSTKAGRESNDKWDLSAERANAARRQLVDHGVTTEQIAKVSGYADTMPMPGEPENSESNRRVTVMLRLSNQETRP